MMKILRRSPREREAQMVVTLYGRPGCHLCEHAETPVMRAVRATPGAMLRHVDIESDDTLRVRYGLRIPVVTALLHGEERVLAEGKVSDVRLRRALAALRMER
jgi:hypothetical protein